MVNSSIVITEGSSSSPNAAPEAGIDISVGTVGDVLDNALAKSVIGLF
jgi:hypothetical protein